MCSCSSTGYRDSLRYKDVNRTSNIKPFNRANTSLGGLKPDGYQVIPVLSYNMFCKQDDDSLIVSETDFQHQMEYLYKNGFTVISPDRLLDFMEFKNTVPPKSVVLTINGGWKSVLDIAYPILKKYNYRATLFVCTDLVGSSNALTWEEIKFLSENGFSIQCLTKTHRNLTHMSEGDSLQNYFNFVENEIKSSKKQIKEKLGLDCNFFAYPYGNTNNIVIAVLKRLGFRGAFTTKRGSTPFFENKFRISRSVIYGNTDTESFRKNLVSFNQLDLK